MKCRDQLLGHSHCAPILDNTDAEHGSCHRGSSIYTCPPEALQYAASSAQCLLGLEKVLKHLKRESLETDSWIESLGLEA